VSYFPPAQTFNTYFQSSLFNLPSGYFPTNPRSEKSGYFKAHGIIHNKLLLYNTAVVLFGKTFFLFLMQRAADDTQLIQL